MNRSLWAALLAAGFSLAGCSCGPAGGSNTSPVRGIIVGRVTDALTGAPIAQVVVKAQADTQVTVNTDADGAFAIKDMPLGGFTVSFDSAGYVRALCTPFLDVTSTSQGTVLARCDMVMAPAEGKLEGFVVTPDGKPVSGMALTADLRSTSGPSLFSGYDLVATTTTAADGSFAFAALPSSPRGTSVPVFFPPFDVNGDGEPDVSGFVRSFTVFPGPAAPQVVVLSSNAPQIVVSNIADNELAPGEAATITWNTPLDTSSATVQLLDYARNVEIPLEKTWTSGITLSAKPANGSQLMNGQRYQLTITARPVGTNNTFGSTWTLYFTVRPSTVNPITAQVTNLAVTAPVTPAHSSTAYTLAFTGVAGAAGYKVFAKDTLLNQDWILTTAFAGTNTGTVYRAFTLPTQFDAYLFDGNVWPLANGNKITFAVVPFDAYGNDAPLSAAPTVQVQDLASPSWIQVGNQSGDAVNDTSATVKVTVPFLFSEPMKASSPPQMVTASGLAATWTWNSDYQGGVFTVSIPANSNGAEGFTIRGGEDQNGNKLANGEATGRLVGIQDFLTNPGFEDGNCSISGWTTNVTGGPPTLGVPTAQATTYSLQTDPKSRCAVAIGSINGNAAGLGTVRLIQQFTVPVTLPAGRALTMRVGVRVASDASPATGAATMRCGVLDSTLTTIIATAYSGFAVSTSAFTTYNTVPALVAGTTYNAVCEVALPGSTPAELGMWVDDVQIGVLFN